MDWSKAHKHTAVNKEMLDQAIAGVGSGLPPGAVQGAFVNVRGDSMTGPLELHGDPVLPEHAATKHYVDAVDNLKLNTWDAIDAGVY